MLRRTVLRCIPEFNFGQTKLSEKFGTFVPQGGATTSHAAAANDVKVTLCPNGARIISHDKGGPQVSVGVYIEAGPKFDPRAAPGLSSVFRVALRTSNMDNSMFQVDRIVRSCGVALEDFEIRKRFVGMRVDSRADMWESPATTLFTGIAAPRFLESDIERFRDTLDAQFEELRWERPREYVVDMLETIAFPMEPLGRPRLVTPAANDACGTNELLTFWSQHCKPERVVIAGVNVAHQALVKAYEDSPFPHSGSAPHHARSDPVTLTHADEMTEYQGGAEQHEQENRPEVMGTNPDMRNEAIAAVGYRSFGFDANIKDFAATLVAYQALNNILKDGIRYEREHTHYGHRAFYRPFYSAGLLGFTVRGVPATFNKALLDAMTAIRGLTAANLDSARDGAGVHFFSNHLDNSRDYCNLLGTSLMAKGSCYTRPDEIVEAIKAVTADDVARVQKCALEERPCMWVTGETYGVPSLRQMGY